MTEDRADVAVIGGSGLYRLLDAEVRLRVDTPYGAPSDEITLAEVGGVRVAFLPRHGVHHTIPPHRINYRANLWALHSLGVQRVIGPSAVGSLRRELAPGDLVVCDQLIDRTHTRADTYFDGSGVAHLSAADPYCAQLRPHAVGVLRDAGMRVHDGGTVVVVQGPRFSTRAESHWYAAQGWDLVNMTQYPEVVLARELGMCYLGLALVTDWDSGLPDDPSIPPVTHAEVLAVFAQNIGRLRAALLRLLETLPAERTCRCGEAPAPVGQA